MCAGWWGALLVPTLTLALTACGNGAGTPAPSANSTPPEDLPVVVLTDPRGDVEGGRPRADDWSRSLPMPRDTHGDIVRTRLQHTETHLLVHVKLADLVKPPRNSYYSLSAQVRTDSSPKWATDAELNLGQLYVGPPMQMFQGQQYVQVDCDGLDHSVDYGTDEITMSVPRECLSDPEWVKVSVFFIVFRKPEEQLDTIDNALVEGHNASADDVYSAPIPAP